MHWPESYAKLQEHACSATELRFTLHWLPVKQCLDYKLAVLTYKARQSGSPSYLASLITDYTPFCSLRSSDKQLLSRPYTSLVMADKAFAVSAPKIWNYLPLNCRAATCVNSFKHNLKCGLFCSVC